MEAGEELARASGPALTSKGGRAQPGAPRAQARPGPGHLRLLPSLVAEILLLGVLARGGPSAVTSEVGLARGLSWECLHQDTVFRPRRVPTTLLSKRSTSSGAPVFPEPPAALTGLRRSLMGRVAPGQPASLLGLLASPGKQCLRTKPCQCWSRPAWDPGVAGSRDPTQASPQADLACSLEGLGVGQSSCRAGRF